MPEESYTYEGIGRGTELLSVVSTENAAEKRKRKNDMILGIGLLFAALCLWLILFFAGRTGQDPLCAVITVNNIEYGVYPLDENIEIVVSEHNTVVIQDKAVYMKEADCPDHLCIHQGRISRTGQTIICLPNRVMVTIKGGKNGYDSVVQ